MATLTPDQEKTIATLDGQMKQIDNMIRDLESRKGATVNSYCMVDVGAGTIGPGGPNGQWVEQCGNYAIISTNPLMCKTHARSNLSRLYAQAQSEVMKIRKLPMKTTAKNPNLFDPTTILIKPSEVAEYFKNIAQCNPNDLPAGSLFGRADAICKALS